MRCYEMSSTKEGYEGQKANALQEIENYQKQIERNQQLIELNKKRRSMVERLTKVIIDNPRFLEPKRAFEKTLEYEELMCEQQKLHEEAELNKLDTEIEVLQRQINHAKTNIALYQDTVKEMDEKLRGAKK